MRILQIIKETTGWNYYLAKNIHIYRQDRAATAT